VSGACVYVPFLLFLTRDESKEQKYVHVILKVPSSFGKFKFSHNNDELSY
jgi:hypothetical protein